MHLQLFPIFLSMYFILNAFFSFGQKDVVLYQSGEKQFRTYCSSCHSVHQEIYGPMLGSISKKRSEEWLISFIQNSPEVIKSGDPYAKHLFEAFNKQNMPAFKNLSKKEIQSILYYLQYESMHPQEYLNDLHVAYTQNSNVIKGRQEFIDHCAPCHFIHKESYFAPALGSVTKRHPRKWIASFIHNSQQVIKSGDVYAKNLYQNFDNHVMTSMDFLTQDEINSILDYIEFASTMNVAYAGEINQIEYRKNASVQIEHMANNYSVVILAGLTLILITLASVLVLLRFISEFTDHSKLFLKDYNK